MKEKVGMSRPGWWSKFQVSSPNLIVVIAAVLVAIYTVNDAHILHNIIVSTDQFTVVVAYLTVGGWFGLLINWGLCHTPAGKLVDPTFQKIKGIGSKAQLSAFLAGTIGAGSTLFMLWGSQLYDPSVILPLSNVTILFVVIWEVITGKVRFSEIVWPAILVISGAFMASVSVSAGFYISVAGLIILLFCKNIISAVGEILEQTGVLASNATSFNFWRFFWLTISGTIIAVVVSLFRGMFDVYLTTLTSMLPALPWILLTMVLVFFGAGLKNVSKKHTTVAAVTMIMTLPIVLGAPLTILVNRLWPDTFKEAPVQPIDWLIRFVGAVLILWGISKLPKQKK